MLRAADAMRVDEVVFLDFRDSGMVGTAENDDPRALVNARADLVVRRLVEIIRRVQPQLVVTFDPSGGYGHPDHIAMHHHTVAAVHAAAVASYAPDLGAVWQVQRLAYVVFPRSVFRDLMAAMEQRGMDTSDFRRFEESGAGWPDDDVPIVVDVSGCVDAKRKAIRAHQTQFGGDSPMMHLPDDLTNRIMSVEHFALAWPIAGQSATLTDLFEGLST